MTGAVAAQVAAAASAVAVVAAVRAHVVSRRGRPPADDRVPTRRTGWEGRLEHRLCGVGVPTSPRATMIAVAAAAGGGAVCVWAVSRSFLLAALVPPVVAALGRAALAAAERRRDARIAAQLPDVAQRLADAVTAGLSLRQGIIRAAPATPEPMAQELRRVAADLALGARVEEALDGMAARLPDPDLGILVTAILVQRRTGGDMARALSDLSRRLDERARLARELRGATAQARATAWMVAAMPALGAAALEVATPGVLGRTLGRGPGLAVLAVAAGLEAAGVVLVRRIARVEGP